MKIPAISAKQKVKINDLLVDYFGIKILQTMEHNGLALVQMTWDILSEIKKKKIVIAYGPDANGGGALAAARLLHIAGARIILISSHEIDELATDTKHQLKSCLKIGIEHGLIAPKTLNGADLIIDGLFGHDIKEEPRGKPALIITLINHSQTTVLSNDLPSGLDSDLGKIYHPTVKANFTLALGLPRTGLLTATARGYVGKLFLADMGVPAELYEKIGINTSGWFSHLPAGSGKKIIRI